MEGRRVILEHKENKAVRSRSKDTPYPRYSQKSVSAPNDRTRVPDAPEWISSQYELIDSTAVDALTIFHPIPIRRRAVSLLFSAFNLRLLISVLIIGGSAAHRPFFAGNWEHCQFGG